jgi:hypothetical protein
VRLLVLGEIDGDQRFLAEQRIGQASAVSVLPVPLGPTSRNTPCGPFSGVRPVFAARRRWAMASAPHPARPPVCRFLFQAQQLRLLIFHQRESGTPVQSAITVATVRTSTSSPSSGLPAARRKRLLQR